MRDLVDAGFEPELAPAFDEALAVEAPATRPAHARALSSGRPPRRFAPLAASASAARPTSIARHGRSFSSTARRPSPLEPFSCCGFADATGVATDFVTALVSGAEARVYLDLAGTTAPSPGSMGRGFGRSFRERLLGVAPFDPNPETSDPPSPTLLAVENPRREVRDGRRALALIARGVAPERIGVVARDLFSPYVSLLQTEWNRLGIPFWGRPLGELGDRRRDGSIRFWT